MNEFLLSELKKKSNNTDLIVELILQDLSLIRDLIYGVSSAEVTIRFKCVKVLRELSKTKPELIYPYFDFFATLLNNPNNIIKWNAIDVLGNLVGIDTESKFEEIFNKYYALLNDGSLITAGHVVDNSGKIAKVKHKLREQITNYLLNIEKITLPTEECRSILGGKVIQAYDQYINHIKSNKAVIAFIKRQTKSSRSATRKRAEKLLEKVQ
jgi:hypothetical protein